MPDEEDILKRLKDAGKKLASAQASEQTTEIIEKSKRTVEQAKKDVRLLDTSKKSTRKRRAGKKR
jgi:hypothetical protein